MSNDFVTSAALVRELLACGVTHVPYLPDSEHSATYDLLVETPEIRLVRVAREGETIAIATGLIAGGKRPLVMIQNTGMFESGDSIRGMCVRRGSLPMVLMIGYRGWVASGTPRDSAALYTEPVLKAWGLPYTLLASDADLPKLGASFAAAERTGTTQVLLILEDEHYAATQVPAKADKS